MESTDRSSNGQRFTFRIRGMKFSASWAQLQAILASMDMATVTA
jgi:hypothetical protein